MATPAARMIDGNRHNRLIRTRHGFLCYNRNDEIVGRSIELYGEYSEAEARLLRGLVGPGDVAIEAGAHIGALTLPLARRVGPKGRVFAFEPQRPMFQLLCANMALNSILHAECFHGATGAANGTTKILVPDYDKPGNFSARVTGPVGDRAVPQFAIDATLDLPRLRLIKIDTEGREPETLAGARKTIDKHQPTLHVANHRPEASRDLIRQIRGLGYRLFWHLPPLFNPRNFLRRKDNAFPRLASINLVGIHAARLRVPPPLVEVGDVREHPLSEDPALRPAMGRA